MIGRASLVARSLAAVALLAGCLLAEEATRGAVALTAALAASALLLALLPLVLRGQRPWSAPLTLAGFTGLAIAGLSLDLGAGWILLAVAAALCAWDLELLEARLSDPGYNGSEARRRGMKAEHLPRLLAVATAGLLLGATALVAQARITFLAALVLSLLALLGLSWVVSFFRASSE